MAPDFARGFLLEEEWPENWRELADYLELTTINFNGMTCTREQVEEAMDLQKPMLVYTIDDPIRAKLLRQWGVDCIITNDPEAVHDGLFKSH